MTAHERVSAGGSRSAKPVPLGERTWPEEIDGLLERTYDPDPRVRKGAVHGLCPCSVRADDGRVWDRLIELAADEDAEVRAAVFHTLCDGSPRSREGGIVEALERMHHDADPKLRRRVRQLLAHYRAGGRLNIL